ncbi:MAG: hypothetical protein RLZZ584_90 [Pseudomonadota bacterium]
MQVASWAARLFRLMSAWALISTPAWAQQAPAPAASAVAGRGLPVAGIVDGPAVLLRQATRYTLLEGVRLQPDDIVEAPKGSVVQVEFSDGTQLALAEGGRLMLQPGWLHKRGASPHLRAYLLQGWFKLSQPAASHHEFATPGWTISHDVGDGKSPPQAGSMVFMLADAASEGLPALNAFIEAGSFRVLERGEPNRNWLLKPDDYFGLRGTDRPLLLRKPAGEFLATLPAAFRDALPARAGRMGEKGVPPAPQGDVSYADVSPWLRGEPAMRLALLERWRSRASDPAFRSALQANLALHGEWERVVFPERFVSRSGASR